MKEKLMTEKFGLIALSKTKKTMIFDRDFGRRKSVAPKPLLSLSWIKLCIDSQFKSDHQETLIQYCYKENEIRVSQ